MNTWPSGWKEAALRAAEIEPTDFNTRILHLWEQATPTDRWTNNPLGMPAAEYATPRALGSAYAAFPTMGHFRRAFASAAHRGGNKPLYTALGTSESKAELYRVIHALGWPANGTETDYPSTILDEIEEAMRAGLMSKKPGDRKTVGVAPAVVDAHQAMRAQARALHHAVTRIGDTSSAIQYVVRSMKPHG